MNNKQNPNIPFFARYLEGQIKDLSEQDLNTISGGKYAVTEKYPSDSDEDMYVTKKYPSDADEDAVTQKYPSDNDEIAAL